MEEFPATVKKLANSPEPLHLTADIDTFSQISRESTQLIEIIDIRDELEIIRSVLTAQKKVLKQLRDVIRSQGRGSTFDDTEKVKTVVKMIDSSSGKAAGDTALQAPWWPKTPSASWMMTFSGLRRWMPRLGECMLR
jgi:hypothetical protein